MTWLKYIIIAVLFFIFSWLQASFFPYFSILGATPNLVFILFFIIAFFDQSSGRAMSITAAIIAGIISDLFLLLPFGTSVAVFLVVYFVYRLTSHFLHSGQSNYLVLYFVGMFSALFLVYHSLMYLVGMLFPIEAGLGATMFMGLMYSLVVALLGFCLGQTFFYQNSDNQLKLL